MGHHPRPTGGPVGSYPSAEVQSAYFTAPSDRPTKGSVKEKCVHCTESSVFPENNTYQFVVEDLWNRFILNLSSWELSLAYLPYVDGYFNS